jgi:phospholipid/cholesterol/gamma-HCH transport system substrate-binding protein
MQKQAPTLAQISIIAAFCLSCVGLLIYLWVTFGGSIPLKPEGYKVRVPFDEATSLASQSDVRITGVSVGKVEAIELGEEPGTAEAIVEIDDEYAPIPKDTRAILRAKTLLGETYVELTPGTPDGPKIPEGGTIPVAQVSEPVQLDEIFRTFDPQTQQGFRTWMQDGMVASAGRGGDLSYAFAQFEPTFHSFNQFFRTLDTQTQAVNALFRNGQATFDALARRQGELQGLITSGNEVFQVMGARNQEIENTFRAFPTFLDESRLTVDRLAEFSTDTDPLVQQLTPAFSELSPTLVQVDRLAPHFNRFFTGLRRVDKAAPRGFDALRLMLREDFPPLLVSLDPFLRNLNPLVEGVSAHRRELAGLFGNAAAATNAKRPGEPNYLRTLPMLGPETLATFPRRLTTNRPNAYAQPGAYAGIPNLLNFETRQCALGINALLDPATPNDPAFNARTSPPGDLVKAQDLFDRIRKFAFKDLLDSSGLPAPGCGKQPPFPRIGATGPATDYQHFVPQSP